MTDKQKIRAEIERRLLPTVRDKYYDEWEEGCNNALINILSFIDTLQEEPVSEDLEEAAKNHAAERYRVTRDRELAEKCKWSFKAGAKWQEERKENG